MVVDRKWLIRHFIVVVALFVIANPLGDNHHGLGKHNAFIATVGQGVFLTFLAALALFVVAAAIATVQAIRGKKPEPQLASAPTDDVLATPR